jgi:hypothetical protein
MLALPSESATIVDNPGDIFQSITTPHGSKGEETAARWNFSRFPLRIRSRSPRYTSTGAAFEELAERSDSAIAMPVRFRARTANRMARASSNKEKNTTLAVELMRLVCLPGYALAA